MRIKKDSENEARVAKKYKNADNRFNISDEKCQLSGPNLYTIQQDGPTVINLLTVVMQIGHATC